MQHWTSRISLDSWPFWLYKACTCVGGGAPKLLAQSSWHDLWVSLLEGAPKSSPLEDGVILSARTKGTKFQSPAGVGLQKSRFLSPTCPLDLLGLKPPPGLSPEGTLHCCLAPILSCLVFSTSSLLPSGKTSSISYLHPNFRVCLLRVPPKT